MFAGKLLFLVYFSSTVFFSVWIFMQGWQSLGAHLTQLLVFVSLGFVTAYSFIQSFPYSKAASYLAGIGHSLMRRIGY
jgi:hypothetical protein